MKRILLVMLTALGLLQLACYKDKGNYDYKEIAVPQISGVDTVYNVFRRYYCYKPNSNECRSKCIVHL